MTSSFRILITGLTFVFQGCFVGTQVNIKSDHLEYPVSYTESFYTLDHTLVDSAYQIIEDFSFSFTKWGISRPLNIAGDEDISARLNNIIKEKNGDAIVALTISVKSAPVNGFLLTTRILSLGIGLLWVAVLVTDQNTNYAIRAASASAVYLFMPAATEVTIRGKVVKIVP
jgi:hypothetical protein